ncbi:MAG: NAD(P)-dependent oxidoreductase, partial [Solirubrobacteraceae bacterium]
KRVLIVGAGAIGDGVRARLLPFEVDVTMVARSARAGVHPVEELPALLPEADVVVVLVPFTDATRGLADAKFFAGMRDGALFINGARGPVADTEALTAEVLSGRLRAALDVTDPEPLPADHPLLSAPHLIVLPHVGSATVAAREAMTRLAVENVLAALDGASMPHPVAAP